MIKHMMLASFIAALALAPALADAKSGNDCQFPGRGHGVGGTPGRDGSAGTYPGKANGGVFPGGNCDDRGNGNGRSHGHGGGLPGGSGGHGKGGGGGSTAQVSEPLTLLILGGGLLGAVALRRRK